MKKLRKSNISDVGPSKRLKVIEERISYLEDKQKNEYLESQTQLKFVID